jgi:hypothetical protein
MMAAVVPKIIVTIVPESRPAAVAEPVWLPDEKEEGVGIAKWYVRFIGMHVANEGQSYLS